MVQEFQSSACGFNQSGVHVPVACSHQSASVGVLASVEVLKVVCQTVIYIPSGGMGSPMPLWS